MFDATMSYAHLCKLYTQNGVANIVNVYRFTISYKRQEPLPIKDLCSGREFLRALVKTQKNFIRFFRPANDKEICCKVLLCEFFDSTRNDFFISHKPAND